MGAAQATKLTLAARVSQPGLKPLAWIMMSGSGIAFYG